MDTKSYVRTEIEWGGGGIIKRDNEEKELVILGDLNSIYWINQLLNIPTIFCKY